MSASPFISAIVPCFNVGSLLERTIDSLLAQTLPPREILVIDDASTSAETLAALKAAEAIPSVRVLRQPTNQGVAAARNRGLDTCRGDFAVFLDADDLFTASSLEAFHTALASTPEASFAYPTVTCFGNRSDTFPAPEFNAYLLHHANICPIASMVSRAAIDSGVRFDPLISIGHEDWDYWLRLVEAGHVGCAAPDAVLLYRRVGFTRNDLGNQMEGGFEAKLRELRPELFDAERLMRLKREWAPGLSIVTDDPGRAEQRLLGQTCRDAEVLASGDAEYARGRVIAFEWDDEGQFLDDPFAVEDVLSMGTFIASDQVLVSLALHAVRPGTPSGIPEATDLQRGWVASSDITAIALPNRWALDLVGGGEPIKAIVEELLLEFGVRQAHRVLWRAPQQPRAPLGPAKQVQTRSAARSTPSPVRRHSHGWTRDVISGLRTGTPWRTASAGGLFGEVGPSAFRELVWVEDPFGGHSLYGTDEKQLVGSRTLIPGPSILRSAAAGAVPLVRVESDATHQRSITCKSPPNGTVLQEVLGHVDATPVPGSRRLGLASDDLHGDPSGACWVPSTLRDGGLAWPRSSSITFAQRVLWRGRHTHDGSFRYGFNSRALANPGAHVDGRLCLLMMEPLHDRPVNQICLVLNASNAPVGLALASTALGALRLGTPIGYLDACCQEGQSPVYTRTTGDGLSLACSGSLDELEAWEGGPIETLGFSWPC